MATRQDPTILNIETRQVKGLAEVSLCECPENGSHDLQLSPMDVLLLGAKQGQIQVFTSFIPHPVLINSSEAIFLAFPRGTWETKLVFAEGSSFYISRMEAGTLHTLINPAFDSHQLEQKTSFNWKDLMKIIPLSPTLLISFESLFHHRMQPPFSGLFEQAKFLEIFSQLLETAFGQRLDTCPVVLSPVIEGKIHQVRRHIMDHVEETPDPDDLAVMYDLPRNTLREGYRFLFGKTIHQYHADHKLESAMQMLASGELLVKEVAYRIGYQNPSHFISAFKKKYGFTPKQYLKQERIAI